MAVRHQSAGGYVDEASVASRKAYCMYWSKTYHEASTSYGLNAYRDRVEPSAGGKRWYGRSAQSAGGYVGSAGEIAYRYTLGWYMTNILITVTNRIYMLSFNEDGPDTATSYARYVGRSGSIFIGNKENDAI